MEVAADPAVVLLGFFRWKMPKRPEKKVAAEKLKIFQCSQ